MTGIGSIPIDQLKPLDRPPIIDLKATNPEAWARVQEGLERLNNRLSDAEISAQLARQRADKVQTVYKLGDRIIGVEQREGGTTFASNGDGGATLKAYAEAESRGLSGQALDDFVSERVTAALREKYGDRLTVESYPNPATAPTAGEVLDQMFGRSGGATAGLPSQRAAFDAESLAILNGGGRR